MRFEFASPPTAIGLDDFGTIESNSLEGVHGDENDAGVSIDTVLGIAIPDSVKNWGKTMRLRRGSAGAQGRTGWLVEMRESGEIVRSFKQRRVTQRWQALLPCFDILHGCLNGRFLSANRLEEKNETQET